ncbi:hypothetical protein ACFZDK_03595 [Streptomyces sp. NPDC007901]|uniref:hypothetical protein n=1 Tax=Streptomyces sp. NPDC007901 TaxID=3364785 RepID=UPI0036E50D16
MPRPAEDETGAPSVYQPQGEPAPPYGEYRDPASAHGWLNAYDETRELPRIASTAPQPGRADRRRAARDTAARRSRRVAVAVGAVGAASVAALIAGFALSSSPDGTQGEQDRTGHATDGSSTRAQAPEGGPGSASAASPSVKSAAPVARTPSARATTPTAAASTAGASASASGSPSATSTRGASTTPTPTATAATSAPTYPGHGWGHGRGGGGRSH